MKLTPIKHYSEIKNSYLLIAVTANTPLKYDMRIVCVSEFRFGKDFIGTYVGSRVSLQTFCLADYNIPGRQYNVSNLDLMFPYTNENWDKLKSMNYDQYIEWFKTLLQYPRWDAIKDSYIITNAIREATHNFEFNNSFKSIIEMTYDEFWEAVISEVWKMDLDWSQLCVNAEEDTDDYIDFQQETLGCIADEAMKNIHDKMIKTIHNHFNSANFPKDIRAKLKNGIKD